jgi:hypothetical protein
MRDPFASSGFTFGALAITVRARGSDGEGTN